MAIGKRIRFFRNRKGMTQKYLGEILGFVGKTSDVRMAQYESEARVPKQELVKNMAHFLDVSTHALTVPDIDTNIGLMHTFFALEDMRGLKIGEVDGEVVLRLDKSNHSTYSPIPLRIRCFVHGSPKLRSWKAEKLPKRNMMNGVTSIRNWIPTKSGQRSTHKSFLILWMNVPRRLKKKKRKKRNAKRKNRHQKTLPIFSYISENQ